MKCFLCHSKEVKNLFQGRDLLHGVDGSFCLVECQQCGMVWISPVLQPEEIDRYYPPGYISFPPAIEDEKNSLRRMDRQLGVDKRTRRVIAHAGRPGKVLDVGSATGIFLNAMKQHGWDCYGIEPSTHAADYAIKRFGLNVFTGFFEESQYPEASFDVITMWDVLEHLANPQEALEKVRKLLKPGGLFVISMPNSSAWERYVFGKYWAGWDVPRHFFIYSESNATRFLSENGFQVENVSSFTGRHGVLVLCIQFWLNDHQLPAWLKKAISFVAKSIPARMLTYPYYMVADRLNKSSTMVVFARKREK